MRRRASISSTWMARLRGALANNRDLCLVRHQSIHAEQELITNYANNCRESLRGRSSLLAPPASMILCGRAHEQPPEGIPGRFTKDDPGSLSEESSVRKKRFAAVIRAIRDQVFAAPGCNGSSHRSIHDRLTSGLNDQLRVQLGPGILARPDVEHARLDGPALRPRTPERQLVPA